jgi:hypothetical protein
LGVATLLGVLFSNVITATQNQERVIERRSMSPTSDEPVNIIAVKVKKGTVEIGRGFPDGDDWFKGLAIKVENLSNKNITFVDVEFSFERPENSERANDPPLVHSLKYGSRLPLDADSARPKRVELIRPGESVNLVLSDLTFSALKRALSKLKYPASIRRLQIHVREVIFDDDTSWSAGRYFRRNPENPDEWLPIARLGSAPRRNAKSLAYSNGIDGWQTLLFRKISWAATQPIQSGSQCGTPGAIGYRTCVGASDQNCRIKAQLVLVLSTPYAYQQTHKTNT